MALPTSPPYRFADLYLNAGGLGPLNGPPTRVAAVTPNDNADLPWMPRALSCTTSGVAYVDFAEGGTNIPIALVAGQWTDGVVKRVRSTGLTAAGVIQGD